MQSETEHQWKSCSDGSLCLWGWYHTALLSEQCRQMQCVPGWHDYCLCFSFFRAPIQSLSAFLWLLCASGWATSEIAKNMQTNRRETMISLMLNCICSVAALYLLIFCMRMSKGFGLRVSKQSPASGLASFNGINLLPKWLLWLTL